MYIILNILIVINNCLTFHTWIGLYNILLHLHHILLRTNVDYLLIVTSSTCRTEYFACKGKVKIRRKNWECGMHCTCLLHMCPFFCLILHAWPCAFVCWLKVCVHVNVCVLCERVANSANWRKQGMICCLYMLLLATDLMFWEIFPLTFLSANQKNYSPIIYLTTYEHKIVYITHNVFCFIPCPQSTVRCWMKRILQYN